MDEAIQLAQHELRLRADIRRFRDENELEGSDVPEDEISDNEAIPDEFDEEELKAQKDMKEAHEDVVHIRHLIDQINEELLELGIDRNASEEEILQQLNQLPPNLSEAALGFMSGAALLIQCQILLLQEFPDLNLIPEDQ